MKLSTAIAGKSVRHTTVPARAGLAWKKNWFRGLAIGLGGWLAVAMSAEALDIVLTDVGSPPMSAEQLAGVESAARSWESVFTDPITVTVNISFAPLGDRVLASTHPARTTHSYSTVRAALIANAESANERNALNRLPAGTSIPITDVNGSRNDTRATITTANAKALGLGTGLDETYGAALANNADASIEFATGYITIFDYDPSDGIGANQIDFISVAKHELGHVLGFFSLTDVQDVNPTLTLHPNTLDLWRFVETGSDHTLPSESRLVTAGAAEYYDSVYSILPMSHGKGVYDTDCGCTGGRCQGHHWRDCLDNQLMDPTHTRGEHKSIHADDKHALSYIGYELAPAPTVRWVPPADRSGIRGRIKWGCPTCPMLIPKDWPEAWPPLPDRPQPPFNANLSVVLGLEMRLPCEPSTKLRSALGFARFQQSIPNQAPLARGVPAEKGEAQLFPDPIPAPFLPPSLTDFFLVSDTTDGVPFTARALFSTSGAQFDPTLGQFGGYRVALAIDSEADGVSGDVDALVTFDLLADQAGVPDPTAQNVFQVDPNSSANRIQIVDALAMKTCQTDANSTETESNNTGATADSLGSPAFVWIRGALGYGDTDFYRFNTPSNAMAWITVDTGGTQAAGANSRDSLLKLYDASLTSILEADDNDGSGNGCNSTLESGDASAIAGCKLLYGGDYYAMVRPVSSNAVINPYRLFLTVTTGEPTPELEPNNSLGTANPMLTSGVTDVRAGTISTTNDVDYYKIKIDRRSLLHISADADPERVVAGPDLVVELLRMNGGSAVVLFSANSSTLSALRAPAAEGFAYLIPTNGIYYVRVKSTQRTTGRYNLMISACPVATPKLSYQSLTSKVNLAWPADAIGFSLQSSSDMRLWTPVSANERLEHDGIVVEQPYHSPMKFFRLRSQE